MSHITISRSPVEEATTQLANAASAKKCWNCGCLHSSLKAIENASPVEDRPSDLSEAMTAASGHLLEVQYDCLGCMVCYPAIAINALEIEVEICATEEVEPKEGWPPLPGSYQVLRYQAPVVVCTLTDEELTRQIAAEAGPEIAVTGTLQTENLGIERLIQNVLGNPHIRFLVICGADSHQTVGHLPGQSLVALAHNGLNEKNRIIGAHGKRPVLRNVSREAVEHFRRTVEVIDLMEESRLPEILAVVRGCAAQDRGIAPPFIPGQVVTPISGYVPERMISDPAGYFVVYVDHQRQLLSLEHYQNNGVLDAVIEGKTPAELYTPAVEKGLLSRLDHAVYLGQELARAEQTLFSGEKYTQDAAPELGALSGASHRRCRSNCGG